MLKSRQQEICTLELSPVQKGYLFRSQDSGLDPGLSKVSAILEGELEFKRLQRSWDELVKRHECLRSCFRRDSSSNEPRQLIFESADWPWELESLDLGGLPVGSIRLQRLGESKWSLEIRCHRALLDGWSVSILLRELLTLYHGGELPEAPKFSEYRSRFCVDSSGPKFWKKLKSQFAQNPKNLFQSGGSYERSSLVLEPQEVAELQDWARQNRISFSTLIHAAWVLTLGAWLGEKSLNLGTGVSGRNASFPELEQLVAPIATVLPIALEFDPSYALLPWLRGIHRRLHEVSKFSSDSLLRIHQWCERPVGERFFESVVLVQGFPIAQPDYQGLRTSDYVSDLSTTYPITVVARPAALRSKSWLLKLVFDSRSLDQCSARLLLETMREVLRSVSFAENLGAVIPRIKKRDDSTPVSRNRAEESFRPLIATDRNQHALQRIWSKRFGFQIGLRDDFFELGGYSLLALSILRDIELELGERVSFGQLIENPTVETLAESLGSGTFQKWESLVPLEVQSSERPLFCIHAQGGHVMHFLPLARALGSEIPVYGIQARGVDNLDLEPHSSLAQMAEHYERELRVVQSRGPYRLLSHCLGVPIALSLAERLIQSGEEIELLALVDASAFLPTKTVNRSESFLNFRIRGWLKMLWTWGVKMTKGEFSQVYREFSRLVRLRLQSWGVSIAGTRLDQIEDNITAIFRAWAPNPYNGKLTFFWSRDIAVDAEPVKKAWSEFALGGAQFRRLDTVHAEILEQPEELSQALKSHLGLG